VVTKAIASSEPLDDVDLSPRSSRMIDCTAGALHADAGTDRVDVALARETPRPSRVAGLGGTAPRIMTVPS